MLYAAIAIFFLATVGPGLCDREHKVHNIVLYPDRHSWCKTTPIKQVVAIPGYEPMTIDNNVCVGACYSYSIPRTEPAEPGELIGPYCDSCQPVDMRCYHVTLKNADSTRTKQKRVEIITNCTCLSCDKIQSTDCEISDENTAELPPDLFTVLYGNNTNLTADHSQDAVEDVPELLNLPTNRSEANASSTFLREHRAQLKSKLIQMVKGRMAANNVHNDEGQVKAILNILENPGNELSEKSLIQLFNDVAAEDIKLDLTKIRESLLKKEELMEKHRNFGLGNSVHIDTAKNNADISRDIEKLGKAYKNFGLEGSHLGLDHYKGSHIGMGIQDAPRDNVIREDAPIANRISLNIQEAPRSTNSIPENKHQHYLGEIQRVGLETGLLIKGPHNSMVVSPIKVEEKLHLESGSVEPNREGVVINYENHP